MAAPDDRTAAPGSFATVDVLIPVAVDVAYSYRVPAGMAVEAGDFVTVPLGPRATLGVVWAKQTSDQDRGANLKAITGKAELPGLRAAHRDFIDWLARWTLTPKGMALRLAVRSAAEDGPEQGRTLMRRTGATPARLTPARERVLEALAEHGEQTKAALARAASCSSGVIDGLIADGSVETFTAAAEPVARDPDPDFCVQALEPAQRRAADQLSAAVVARKPQAILLQGVTGSGKTFVYLEAVAAALRLGRQVLVMMPEIALTGQVIDRFTTRFGVMPATWHSGVAARRRAAIWTAVASDACKVVIGARSSLFLPFADLGLIVVDEEHDAAYKQEDGVTYHARDMAVVRGRLENAPVVLASATPSLETLVNAQDGRYGHVQLAQRTGGRQLPALASVDLKATPPTRGTWIASPLRDAIGETVERGEQALLYLNRRGYAPLTLCRTCGHRFRCLNCSAWLVEHRFRRSLLCHHCGHAEARPDRCPTCQNVDTLVPCGPGVERLAEEVAAAFPAYRSIVLSSDAPGGAAQVREQLDAVARGEVDIVIGTQLIAKGHNFPRLTLVGVVDADVGLSNGDPRAAERTFQILQQVTGRAGRGDKPGRGLIQSWEPGHPVIRALVSGDAERFYAVEAADRYAAGLPPFGRMAALIVSSGDKVKAEGHARALARAAAGLLASLKSDSVTVLGPAEAPIAMLRGRFRFRLLTMTRRSFDLQGFLRTLLAKGPKLRGDLRTEVDVDPQSFL